jgi:hypothetical protein
MLLRELLSKFLAVDHQLFEFIRVDKIVLLDGALEVILIAFVLHEHLVEDCNLFGFHNHAHLGSLEFTRLHCHLHLNTNLDLLLFKR